MKIFLTGGTGFIGSYVVKNLSECGYSITVLARNPNKVPGLKDLPGVFILPGEIDDFELIKENFPGHEALVHIALHWGDSPTEMLLKDTQSSVQLFEIAAKAGVKEIIYTSSTAVNDSVYMDQDAYEKGVDMNVYENTKQLSVTYYGATKGATELFLNAVGYEYLIKTNTIRPGYTYGNPVIEGAYVQPDTRFRDIVTKVVKGEGIEIVKNDGTQFIWAGDLAKIYRAVLQKDIQGKMYLGLAENFISWEALARKAISQLNSKSKLTIKDLGWSDVPILFDVAAIKRDFNLSFDAWEKIEEHIDYFSKKV